MVDLPRNPTREVRIGSTAIGAGHDIAVQSMTATHTQNIDATIAQVNALAEAGADVVRIAVDWADAGAVEAVLSREGLSARDRSFSDGVGFVVDVPVAQVDATRAALRDGCQGRARVSCSEDGSDA